MCEKRSCCTKWSPPPPPPHPPAPPNPICSRARALNLVLGWGDCLGRPQGAVGVSTNSCFLKIEQYRRESTWVDGEGWGEGSPPHLRAKSHTLVRAAVPVWKKAASCPAASPAATCRIAARLLRDCELQLCAPSDKSNDCTCTGSLL